MKQPQVKMRRDVFGNPYYVFDETAFNPVEEQSQGQTNTVQKQSINDEPVKQVYTIVKSEKEAYDFPIVNSFDEKLGKVHFFVLVDEPFVPGQDIVAKSLFTKRINPSNFEMEFEIYDRRKKDNEPQMQTQTVMDKEALDRLEALSARLDKLEELANDLPSLLQQHSAKEKLNKMVKDKEKIKEEVVD